MWQLNHTVIEERLKLQRDQMGIQSFVCQSHGWHFRKTERVIRSIRLSDGYGAATQQTLTDDSLATLLSEAEFIINSCPLIPVVLDASGDEPLTPNDLLRLRSVWKIDS